MPCRARLIKLAGLIRDRFRLEGIICSGKWHAWLTERVGMTSSVV